MTGTRVSSLGAAPVRRVRANLVEALRAADPDAPTLCEGWSARHIAAHVLLRERRPWTMAPTMVPRLSYRTENLVQAYAGERGDRARYEQLIDDFENGPSRFSPYSWAGTYVNLLEYAVHAEDVRRGLPGWSELDFDAETIDAIWSQFKRGASLMMRRRSLPSGAVPHGLIMVADEGPRAVVRSGFPRTVLRGPMMDLVIYAFGRDEVTLVEA